jgi:hypothetical protein
MTPAISRFRWSTSSCRRAAALLAGSSRVGALGRLLAQVLSGVTV